jgi:hypothetical protein
MSQIRIPSLALGLFLLLSLSLLSGCGDKNSQADLDPSSGKHPASWLPAGHSTAAKNHFEACTECHGSDFSGGISKIACTQCHLGNEEAPHPVFWNYTATQPTAWGTYAYAFHSLTARQLGLDNAKKSCGVASCHGADLLGGTGTSGPSCKSCHKDIMSVHPVEWVMRLTHSPGGIATIQPDHGNWVNNVEAESCKNAVCHGAQGQGVFLSGLACVACHNSSF